MTALAFDTHQFVKELTAAGFSEAQAEAVTSVVKRTRAQELEDLATRRDLEHLSTKADVSDAKWDVVKWTYGAIGFQTAVMIGAFLTAGKHGP